MARQIQHAARSYFVVLIGMQVMYLCFVTFGSVRVTAAGSRQFTSLGAKLFQPEHELGIYLAGVVGTVLLSMILERWVSPSVYCPKSASASSWSCAVATAGALVFVVICTVVPAASGKLEPAAILFGCLAVIWALVVRLGMRMPVAFWFKAISTRNIPRDTACLSNNDDPAPGVVNLIIALLLVAMVYIPDAAGFAGTVFSHERLHHWDFFAMGPAIGYQRGGALGSEVYSQYGVGFPLLAALVSRWLPLTYENMLRIALVTGCAYYVGLYAFLRAFLRSWKWAVLGVLLALDLQLFHGVDRQQVLWQFPSSTIMRSPFDICIFAAILLDIRSANRLPLAVASLLVGFAILFETDTGIYLAFTLGCYVALSRWKPGLATWRNLWPNLSASLLPGLIVAFLGLQIAGRGQAASGAFVAGWLEVFRLYPSGIGMLPITISRTGMLLSFVLITTYLSVLCRHVTSWQQGGISRRSALFAGLAIYGLCYLTQFIGRSHPYNLFHSCIPFVVLAVALAKAAFDAQPEANPDDRAARLVRRSLPLALAGLVLAQTFAFSGFRDYPNLFHPRTGIVAKPDSGVVIANTGVRAPAGMQSVAENIRLSAHNAAQLSAAGRTVLFVVNNDPIYYLASGARSPFRYSPLFQAVLTMRAQAAFERRFLEEHIDYVFLDRLDEGGLYGNDAQDVRQSLRLIIAANYKLDHLSGSFEVWRHL